MMRLRRGKCRACGFSPGRHFGDQQRPVPRSGRCKLRILVRVSHVHAARQHRDGPGRQCCLVRRGVYPARQPRDDHRTTGPKVPRQPFRHAPPKCRGVARTDQRDRDARQTATDRPAPRGKVVRPWSRPAERDTRHLQGTRAAHRAPGLGQARHAHPTTHRAHNPSHRHRTRSAAVPPAPPRPSHVRPSAAGRSSPQRVATGSAGPGQPGRPRPAPGRLWPCQREKTYPRSSRPRLGRNWLTGIYQSKRRAPGTGARRQISEASVNHRSLRRL